MPSRLMWKCAESIPAWRRGVRGRRDEAVDPGRGLPGSVGVEADHDDAAWHPVGGANAVAIQPIRRGLGGAGSRVRRHPRRRPIPAWRGSCGTRPRRWPGNSAAQCHPRRRSRGPARRWAGTSIPDPQVRYPAGPGGTPGHGVGDVSPPIPRPGLRPARLRHGESLPQRRREPATDRRSTSTRERRPRTRTSSTNPHQESGAGIKSSPPPHSRQTESSPKPGTTGIAGGTNQALRHARDHATPPELSRPQNAADGLGDRAQCRRPGSVSFSV